MLAAGTKAVDEWTPSAAGVGALTAPQSLEANLAGIKADLLADAPSDLAREQASADLDTHISSFLDRGRKIAQDGFKGYARDTNTGWMNTLLGIAAQSGGDPATQQWVLDTGKASWIALGRNGLVITPEEAVQGAAQFEKDAAKAYLLGQMTTPALQNKAMAEYQSGQFDDVLSSDDKQRFDDKVAAIKAQQQADATKAQNEAHGRLALAQGGSAADLQDQMVQDSLTLHPQILAAKYSLDQLQEQHRQGVLTAHQVSILDALRQGRVDHHVDALGRDAFARIGEDDMTPKEFDAHFAGMMLPSTERALRAMMNNPALNTREAKAAEAKIAAMVATPQNGSGTTADALVSAARNKALTGQAGGMFRDLFTNQGMSMEQARNQAIVANSPHFDDTAAPPDSLRALGIVGYPDKVSNIDFAAAERRILVQAANGLLTNDQCDSLWEDLEQFRNDISRRDQFKAQVTTINNSLKGGM